MPRSHDAEVALVESAHLRLVQPLGEGDHARINDAECQVPILVLELATALQIDQRRGFDGINAPFDILEEDQPRVDRQALRAPVVELAQHQGRNNQVLGRTSDEAGAAFVVWISRVQRRQQGSGVEDERHSARRLCDRLAGNM